MLFVHILAMFFRFMAANMAERRNASWHQLVIVPNIANLFVAFFTRLRGYLTRSGIAARFLMCFAFRFFRFDDICTRCRWSSLA